MSKKMLKRSLALGALMAFVITGSAWAAELNSSTIVPLDGNGETFTLSEDNVSLHREDNGENKATISNAKIVVGENQTLTLSRDEGNWGEGGVIENVIINEDGSKTGTVILREDGEALSRGENVINADTVWLIASDAEDPKGICADGDGRYTVDNTINAREVYIDSKGDGIHTQGTNEVIVDINGFDKLVISAQEYGIQDANSYTNHQGVRLVGSENVGSEISINSIDRPAISAESGTANILLSKVDYVTIEGYSNNSKGNVIRAINGGEIGITDIKKLVVADLDTNKKGNVVELGNGSAVNFDVDDIIQITGNIKANSGTLTGLTLSGSDSFITGAIDTKGNKDKAVVSFSDGATWNVTGASEVEDFDGDGGVIAIDEAILGTAGAVTIAKNTSRNTVVKARDLNLSGGAKEALTGLEEKLRNTVLYSNGDEFTYEASAVDVALRGDVELVNDRVVTTMDTDDLVVNGDVKAGEVSLKTTAQGVKENADAIALKADAETVNTALAGKVDAGDTTGAENSVAVGKNSTAEYSSNSVALGEGADADASQNSIAMGYMAKVNGAESSVAIGSGSQVLGNRSLALGFSSKVQSAADSSVALGTSSSVWGKNSVAIGESSKIGSGMDQNVDNSVAIGANSTVKQNASNSIALGANSVADRENTVSVGSAGKERQITNVKAGTEMTDAVNKGQLDNAVSDLQTKITANSTAIGTLQENVNANTETINALKNNVNTNTEAIGSLQTGVATNKQAIETNAEAIKGLDGRVSASETVIASNTQAIQNNADAIAKEISERQAAIGILSSRVDTVQQDLDTAVDRISEKVAGQIGEVAKSVETVQSDLESTNEQVATNKEAIVANKQAIEDEAKTRETKDNELLEKINQIDGGSSQAINGINQRLDKTNAKINKVGAGAAALAALHPLDYDPDDKLTFSAGIGNYAGENAAALGAFYRPNEKFMVSLGGTMGNGENMVNLGLSIGLDKANGFAKMSKRELIQEVNAVKAENEAMKAEMAEMKAMLQELMAKK